MTHVLKISPADFADLGRKKNQVYFFMACQEYALQNLRCLRAKIFITDEHRFSQMIIGNSEKFFPQ